MRKHIPALLLILILAACGSRTEVPLTESTSTPAPTAVPTSAPTQMETIPTVEITLPTIPPTEEPSNLRVSSVDGMPQVLIPAGTLHMGGYDVRRAPDEVPTHDVTLDAFWMDQLEVTNAMYQLCVQTGPCTPPQNFGSQRRKEYFTDPEFKDYPVVYVAWVQAKTYCEWAGRRLPTEAEWERAGRGDDLRTFPWGEDKADYRFANFNFIVRDTSRVGTYPMGASPFGVLDMAGNVAEWTNDFYSPTYYSISVAANPIGPAASSNFFRVVRGGSLGDAEINIRVSKRSSVLGSDLSAIKGTSEYLGDFSPRIGFRCAEDE
ncbi:MAG: formylglycine-generating enzyme family protein [Anaerolineae bacterium]|nr:formylglycine-generating enzyme family protein [Anaerolineae bacterium]